MGGFLLLAAGCMGASNPATEPEIAASEQSIVAIPGTLLHELAVPADALRAELPEAEEIRVELYGDVDESGGPTAYTGAALRVADADGDTDGLPSIDITPDAIASVEAALADLEDLIAEEEEPPASAFEAVLAQIDEATAGTDDYGSYAEAIGLDLAAGLGVEVPPVGGEDPPAPGEPGTGGEPGAAGEAGAGGEGAAGGAAPAGLFGAGICLTAGGFVLSATAFVIVSGFQAARWAAAHMGVGCGLRPTWPGKVACYALHIGGIVGSLAAIHWTVAATVAARYTAAVVGMQAILIGGLAVGAHHSAITEAGRAFYQLLTAGTLTILSRAAAATAGTAAAGGAGAADSHLALDYAAYRLELGALGRFVAGWAAWRAGVTAYNACMDRVVGPRKPLIQQGVVFRSRFDDGGAGVWADSTPLLSAVRASVAGSAENLQDFDLDLGHASLGSYSLQRSGIDPGEELPFQSYNASFEICHENLLPPVTGPTTWTDWLGETHELQEAGAPYYLLNGFGTPGVHPAHTGLDNLYLAQFTEPSRDVVWLQCPVTSGGTTWSFPPPEGEWLPIACGPDRVAYGERACGQALLSVLGTPTQIIQGETNEATTIVPVGGRWTNLEGLVVEDHGMEVHFRIHGRRRAPGDAYCWDPLMGPITFGPPPGGWRLGARQSETEPTEEQDFYCEPS